MDQSGASESTKEDDLCILLPTVAMLARILNALSVSLLIKLIPVRLQRAFHELYVLVWLGLLVFLLTAGHSGARWSVFLVIYRIADILGYRLYFVFHKSLYRPWSALRIRETLIYAALNSAELVIGFAVLYLSFGAIENQRDEIVKGPLDALYFSSTTMLTVGFGDFIPISPLGRELVLFQFVSMVIFVLLMLPLVLSVLSSRLVKSE
jgi:hypothetical protein